MNDVDEVMSAAIEHALPAQILGENDADDLWELIRSRYFAGRGKVVARNIQLASEASINTADGWKHLAFVCPSGESVLFFEEDRDRRMIHVSAPMFLPRLVSEASAAPYFIASMSADWLICDSWNMLHAWGAAAKRLGQIR